MGYGKIDIIDYEPERRRTANAARDVAYMIQNLGADERAKLVQVYKAAWDKNAQTSRHLTVLPSDFDRKVEAEVAKLKEQKK